MSLVAEESELVIHKWSFRVLKRSQCIMFANDITMSTDDWIGLMVTP